MKDPQGEAERFVRLWMTSEVLAFAESLRAEGVELPLRPVRYATTSRLDD